MSFQRHIKSSVAKPKNSPMLATSVAVVRKMLDAVAGSAPNFFSVSGTLAPAKPLATQEPTIDIMVMPANINAFG